MNQQNPTETNTSNAHKPTFRERLARTPADPNATSKSSSLKEKAKTVAAVVGVVSVAGVIAASAANKRRAKVEVTLPNVDVTTTDV